MYGMHIPGVSSPTGASFVHKPRNRVCIPMFCLLPREGSWTSQGTYTSEFRITNQGKFTSSSFFTVHRTANNPHLSRLYDADFCSMFMRRPAAIKSFPDVNPRAVPDPYIWVSPPFRHSVTITKDNVSRIARSKGV